MSDKKKRRDRKREQPPPQRVIAGLNEAATRMKQGRMDEAREVLEGLERRHPNDMDVLSALSNVAHQTRDAPLLLRVAERLAELEPRNVGLRMLLAGAYLLNLHVVHALREFRRIAERWPDHPNAAEARETVARLEPEVARMLAEEGLPGDEGRELGLWFEEMKVLVGAGKYPNARRVGEKILARKPDFLPVLNNISETWAREGKLEQASAAARRVLDAAPDNYHALSNLTRFLALAGKADEAHAVAERLRAVQSPVADAWVKKAEAFSVLGDDAAVLAALGGAEASGERGPGPNEAFLSHLAAVATQRQGQEDEARRLWRDALARQPGFDLTETNLRDLDQPVGERHAPWPFSLPYWLPRQTLDALITYLGPSGAGKKGKDSEEATRQRLQGYLQANPAVAALVPVLLDRGDPPGREFAVRLALTARTPGLLAALRDFALGQRGPDALRMQAIQAAQEAGLLPPGTVRLWLEGDWREILLFGFELSGEPTHRHPPEVEELAREGMEATKRGDGVTGERLLKQALEREPNAPDLLNNLATAYQAQDRHAEAQALAREIHERFPDYLFGRTAMAQMSMREGNTERAKELLRPLLERRRLHFTEFAALAAAEVELLLAEGNVGSAEQWLQLWEQGTPGHPAIAHWRQQVRRAARRGEG